MVAGHIFEWLDAADKAATVALNFDGGSGADLFFHTVSSTFSWIPLGAAFLWLVCRECRGDWAKMLAVVIGLAVTVTLCDRISAGIIKPLFMRLRPSHDSEVCWMLHYVGNHRGGLYGFVSSHAANAFFPSGHTATAFMTATMLAKEYGGRSPWISIGAYSMAAAIKIPCAEYCPLPGICLSLPLITYAELWRLFF